MKRSNQALVLLKFLIQGLLIFISCAGAVASAADPNPVPLELSSGHFLSIGSQFSFYEDQTSRLTVQDALHPRYQAQFVHATPDDFNGKFTSSHYWVKFTLRNRTDVRDWYIKAQQPLMSVKTYRLSEGNQVIEELSLERRLPVSKIVIPSGTDTTFILKVQSSHLVGLQFDVMNEETLAQIELEEVGLISLVAGCFAAMILYNFFLYISLWDKNHLYYLLFALVNGHLGLMAVNFPMGITQWFGIDWCDIANFYRPLGPLTAFVFSRSFLQIKANCPRIDWTFKIYMGGLVGLMLASTIVSLQVLSSLCDLYFLVGIFILFHAGLVNLRRGFKPARYYLLGLGSFLMGVFIYLGSLQKIFPINAWTGTSHLVGQAVEMLLMSLALAAKIKLLQADKTRAEVVIQMKSRLLRVIAHDIANPLTVIKAVADILRDRGIQVPYMEKIQRSVEIIQDITGFVLKSDSVATDWDMLLKPVLIRDVFEQLALLFQGRADEKKLVLNFTLEHPNLAVMAEKTTLTHEVFGNLLSNAIKFSFAGGHISLRAYRRNRNIVIAIKDQGIGMDQDMLPRLFTPSKAQSRPGTQNEIGTGYGLFLVKSFVSAYGGHIQVKSKSIEEGADHCGTLFEIIIPVADAPVDPSLAARLPLSTATVKA